MGPTSRAFSVGATVSTVAESFAEGPLLPASSVIFAEAVKELPSPGLGNVTSTLPLLMSVAVKVTVRLLVPSVTVTTSPT